MEALRETTGGQFPAHTYLLDGTTLVAYIKVSETTPFYFKNGIKHFDKRGRKFETVSPSPFKDWAQLLKAHVDVAKSNLITVKGSNGKEYTVDSEQKTCTCPGFTFRGSCKHLAENG
jgi:hypothetical protein